MYDYWPYNRKHFWSHAALHAHLVVILDILGGHAYVQSRSLTDHFVSNYYDSFLLLAVKSPIINRK